jgi:hypothetical protein
MSRWPTRPLGQFCDTRLGKMLDRKRDYGGNPRPYLRNVNVQWGRFDLSNLLYMDFDEEERQILRIKSGDLLVCEGGELGEPRSGRDKLRSVTFKRHFTAYGLIKVSATRNICICISSR